MGELADESTEDPTAALARTALETLEGLMRTGTPEQQIEACRAIFEVAYGIPVVCVECGREVEA